jgi:MFS family permease
MEGIEFRKRYYLIFLSSILGPLTTNALVPIFEQLRLNFNLSSIAVISLAITFYILPFAIFQLFAGTFSDIVDKKKVILLGYVIFISGLFVTLIAVLIKHLYLFLIAFLFLGIGFSFVNPTILAILNVISPEKKKGLLMGLYNSTGSIGVSMGALLSGLFASSFSNGRIFIFILNPILAIVFFVLFKISLRNCEPLICKPFDVEKSDLSQIEKSNSKFIATLRQLKAGFNVKIFLLGVIGLLCFFSVIALTNTLSEQMKMSMKETSEREIIFYVSLILAVNGLISVILSPIAGMGLRKINPFLMMGIGFAFMVPIIFLSSGESFLDFLIINILAYVGSALVWPALFKVSMEVDPRKSGTISAIINSLRFIGYSMVGPFYFLFGIPVIYYFVLLFNILAILIIIIMKILKYNKEISNFK